MQNKRYPLLPATKHNYVIGRKIEFFKHKKVIFFEIIFPISPSLGTKEDVTSVLDSFFLFFLNFVYVF